MTSHPTRPFPEMISMHCSAPVVRNGKHRESVFPPCCWKKEPVLLQRHLLLRSSAGSVKLSGCNGSTLIQPTSRAGMLPQQESRWKRTFHPIFPLPYQPICLQPLKKLFFYNT